MSGNEVSNMKAEDVLTLFTVMLTENPELRQYPMKIVVTIGGQEFELENGIRFEEIGGKNASR